MGKTFKDRKDVKRNNKEISKLKKQDRRKPRDDDRYYDINRRDNDGE